MKKLIMETPSRKDVVYLDDVKNSTNVGWIFDSTYKGYAAQTMEGFVGISNKKGAGCNTYFGGAKSSIIGVLNTVVDCNANAEFYVFNTRKELYKWLAE